MSVCNMARISTREPQGSVEMCRRVYSCRTTGTLSLFVVAGTCVSCNSEFFFHDVTTSLCHVARVVSATFDMVPPDGSCCDKPLHQADPLLLPHRQHSVLRHAQEQGDCAQPPLLPELPSRLAGRHDVLIELELDRADLFCPLLRSASLVGRF